MRIQNKISLLLMTFTLLACTVYVQANPTPAQPTGSLSCPLLPANNIWNARVDNLPLDPNSNLYIQTIGANANVHADFGSGEWDGGPIGIPYIEVPGNQPMVDIHVVSDYPEESDPGPYPVPANAPIEGGPNADGDRHVLVLNQETCILYELYRAFPNQDGSWDVDSGAIFDLNSNALRPDGWTSADAAGLPILPGLVRYEEVMSGVIDHAIRFTAPETRREYIWPARHFASDLTDIQYPPMGQRFRLRADFDISGYSQPVQVILTAMKQYGIILADNGSSWYISGSPNENWDNDMLHELDDVLGSDFEAVDVSSLMIDPDSGQVAVEVDLAIEKTGPPFVAAGDPITYTLTIANSGTEAATNLHITDSLPAGATFVGSPDGGTVQGQTVSWDRATLGSNSSLSVQFVVTATQSVWNVDYEVTADNEWQAVGTSPVLTLIDPVFTFLPMIRN